MVKFFPSPGSIPRTSPSPWKPILCGGRVAVRLVFEIREKPLIARSAPPGQTGFPVTSRRWERSAWFTSPGGRPALLYIFTGLRFPLVLRRLVLRYPHATRLHWKKKEADVARETRGAALGAVRSGERTDLGKSDRDRQVATSPAMSRENVALTRLPAQFPQDGRTRRKRRESLTCRGMTALQPALVRAARHPVALASVGTSNVLSSQYAAVDRCRCQHALTASPSPIQSR